MWRRWRVALAVTLALLLAVATAAALSDGVSWYTPDSGGCTSGSGWTLCGAAGQPDAHTTPGLFGGFYHPIWTATPTASATPPASSTPTATPTASATATPTPGASPTPTTTASPAASATPLGDDMLLPGGAHMRIVRRWTWDEVAILAALLALTATRIIRWAWREFA